MLLAVLTSLTLIPTIWACSFCSSSWSARATLRDHLSRASVVLQGTLANPSLDAADNGRTEFHLQAVLKGDSTLAGQRQLVIPRYLPVLGDTPREHLIFGHLNKNLLDPIHGLPANPARVEYLQALARLDPRDPVKLLGFYFARLDSPDPEVASDAFIEFARASDHAIFAAARQFDPARLRKLIAHPQTPPERLGVFGLILGACGGPEDANFLAQLLRLQPRPERISSALSGLLAGYILLQPDQGWKLAYAILSENTNGFSDRLAVISTLRFFHNLRPQDDRKAILTCYTRILDQGDLADQAIEDLRQWKDWDLTDAILSLWNRPTHKAPIVRRSIVRYALSCPRPEAKSFIEAIRKSDPQLVHSVSESLAAFEAIR